MLSIRYSTHARSRAELPTRIDVCEVFGVESLDADGAREKIRATFRTVNASEDRQTRAFHALAYAIATTAIAAPTRLREAGFERVDGESGSSGIFTYDATNPFVLCAAGDAEKLRERLSRAPRLLDRVSVLDQTLCYLAARTYRDVTEMLLEFKVDVNARQTTGSTPLHAASFYGLADNVRTLLAAGANPDAKNKWGATPRDEARNDAVKQAFAEYDGDAIGELARRLKDHSINVWPRVPRLGRRKIGAELCAPGSQLRREGHVCAFVGTTHEGLVSILQHGLRPRDTAAMRPPGVEEGATRDADTCLYVTRSAKFAAHEAFAPGRILIRGSDGAVAEAHLLVRVSVKEGSFTTHRTAAPAASSPSTTTDATEMTSVADVLRVASVAGAVVVEAICMPLKGFLDTTCHTADEINDFILNEG